MRTGLAVILLLSGLFSFGGCTLWREHPVSSWTDATGGEGLERSFWKDVKDKNWNELEHHIASNYVGTTMAGARLDRAQTLEHLRQLQLNDYSLGDLEVEMQGNTLVVTYTVTLQGTLAQQPLPPDSVRMMTVWQQQKAGWMAIAHSVTGPVNKQ